MRSILPVIFFICGSAFLSPVLAEEAAGHIDWESWSFDWEVTENTGLALRNVSYDGELVLAKATMPVIRVKYVKDLTWWNPFSWFGSRASSGRCGPFQDRIQWRELVPIKNCGEQKLCVESYTHDGITWLELGAYARIGLYHIYETWYLSDDGEIHPVMHSKGLSCNTDHDHHPYWRLDFDVNGNGIDQVFVYDEGGPNEGWGPGWRKYTNERNDRKSRTAKRVWFVRDQPTRHGVWVIPGGGYSPLKDDGVHDRFSDRDVAIRRSHRDEVQPWPFGARGELGYDEDNEGVQEQDIVFWYVAHLPHMAAVGPAKWLAVGPVLRVHR